MTTPIQAMIRDAQAQREAVRAYDRAAERLFILEDRLRASGRAKPELIAKIHDRGRIAGHAAWAEHADPEPR